MKRLNWKGKTAQNILAIALCLCLIVVCAVIIRTSATENAPGTWADEYQARIAPRFADSTLMNIMQASDLASLEGISYNSSYDVDADGTPENVNVSFAVREGVVIAGIYVDGYDSISYEMEALGGNSKAFAVMGVRNDDGRTGIAVVESVYAAGGGLGKLNCHVWSFDGQMITKEAAIGYISQIGQNGFIDIGTVTNDVPQDSFSWSMNEHQNNFMYNRSRMMADMREWGVLFPYGTVDKFMTNYKYKVVGLYHLIIK